MSERTGLEIESTMVAVTPLIGEGLFRITLDGKVLTEHERLELEAFGRLLRLGWDLGTCDMGWIIGHDLAKGDFRASTLHAALAQAEAAQGRTE